MHIGKNYYTEICGEGSIDAWSETLMTGSAQTEQLQDNYLGKENMKSVSEKIYLGNLTKI